MMSPPDARTLSGELASSQHLVEFRLSPEGWVLPAVAVSSSVSSAHTLIFCLQGRVACVQGTTAWHLETGHFAWLTPIAATTLRPVGLHVSEILLWRFESAALPSAFHPLLPPCAPAPAHRPAALTPSMESLILALRGCPVAPSLRNLWGAAKLTEFITLILPPPADSSPARATARVLHPVLRAALDCMTARLADSIGLSELAAAAHTSPSHLSRLFSAEFGHGPTVHLRCLRLEHASTLLRSGQTNVTEAALACGYQSLGHFSRAFSAQYGCPPSALIPRASR